MSSVSPALQGDSLPASSGKPSRNSTKRVHGKSIAVQRENCSLVIVGALLDRVCLLLSAVVQAPQVEKGCENEKVLNI